ncbi:hypothetical protein SY83_22440 [Paenibacillus swuensis]|uniref:AraC family transcriptional regulator n=1 Tax=Paenibacillus swuensis TaxID=1178515 RepID=A0A172TNG8_9BACL|nr:response regulator [Paenibacillus swuensis]ANE48588.1 hypothetical protein SY83_22440 [Paenibacillus swuensis]
MTQLLIVDDEVLIANGLAESLDWPSMGIDTVFKAYSAERALELMQEHTIDIVITDIRMPDIDGLTLLRIIRRKWKKTKVILLTGYSDFDYAQEAIREQAVDYMLKPVRKDLLEKTVRGVLEQLRQEWEEVSSFHKAMQTLRGHLPELKANLLNDIMNGMKFPVQDLEEKLDWFNLSFRLGETCQLILLRPEYSPGTEGTNSKALLEYALLNIAEEGCKDLYELWSCKDHHQHLILLIKPIGQNESTDQGTGIERFATQYYHNVKQYLRMNVTLFLGEPGPFPSGIRGQYEQALSSLRKQSGDSERFLVQASEPFAGATVSLSKLHEPPLLNHLFEVGRWEGVTHKLKEVYTELQESGSAESGEQVSEIYFQFAAAVCSSLHKQGKSVTETLGPLYHRMLDGVPLRGLSDLKDWTGQVVERLRQEFGDDTRTGRQDLIQKMQDYMVKNMANDITLHSIADHVFMHPTHLSKVYKQETGEGISDFLLRLRMEHAAYLLTETDKRSYEVGCDVGYVNANYFTRVFKKHYDMTPQDYRDKIRLTKS